MRGKEGVEGDRKGRVGGGERETRQEQGSLHARRPLPAKRLPARKKKENKCGEGSRARAERAREKLREKRISVTLS